MSWLNVKKTVRTSNLPFTVSLGAPNNGSSSLHKTNNPVASGAIDPDAVNTDGVLSFKGFTLWGAWNMGGTNTMQVVSVDKEITKNVVEKIAGYSWCSAVGSEATRFSKGIRRYEVHVRRKSGPLQVGIMAVPSSGQSALPSNWNDPSCVDSAWYVSETGEIRNGNRCLLRTHKPINEGDVIGIEIDMDYGIVVFRKIPLSLKGQHLFGAPCPVCGTNECREWNREETSPRPGASATQAQPCLYGFMGVSREVMCYKNRVTLGNLPVGTVDADGVWMHANKQRMQDVVLEFMSKFAGDGHEAVGPCPICNSDVCNKCRLIKWSADDRSMTFELQDALAVTDHGLLFHSALHRVLQVLVHPDGEDLEAQTTDVFAGSDVHAHEQRFFLRDWMRRHQPSNTERWSKWLGAPKGEYGHEDYGHPCGKGEGLLVDLADYDAAIAVQAMRQELHKRINQMTLKPDSKWALVQKRLGGTAGEGLLGPAIGAMNRGDKVEKRILPEEHQRSLRRLSQALDSPVEEDNPSLAQQQSAAVEMRHMLVRQHTELDVVGPWIMTASGRGSVMPAICMAATGTCLHLAATNDALEQGRITEAQLESLRREGSALLPWARQLTDSCIMLPLPHRAVKTANAQTANAQHGGGGTRTGSSRRVYCATAISTAWISRLYPPRVSDYPKQGWQPHPDGAWKMYGDRAKWVAGPDADQIERRINIRRFDVKLLQVGLHGKINSSGILVGVLAPGSWLKSTLSVDRNWKHGSFNGFSWFADGARGRDHNKKPTGGALYAGALQSFPFATIKMPIFKQGDTIGIEINLGKQKLNRGKDGSEIWVQDNPCQSGAEPKDGEDIGKGEEGSENIPVIRFFHNGNRIAGNMILWNTDRSDKLLGETLPLHPAVCLHEDGDSAELSEIGWVRWPCPHDSYQACKKCTEQNPKLKSTKN